MNETTTTNTVKELVPQTFILSTAPLDPERGDWTSASSAPADNLCKGRFLAQRGIPGKESEFASTGSRIHDALHVGSSAGLTMEETETYDLIRRIELSLVRKFFGPDEPAACVREHRLWMAWKNGEKIIRHSGKPDVVYATATRALVVEYKTLFGDVPEATSNEQLRDQVVLVANNWHPPGVQQIGCAVIQPAVKIEPSVCLYDVPALLEAHNRLMARVNDSHDPKSKRVAGDEQCRHCLAKPNCVEHQLWAGAAVPQLLSVLDVPVSNWTPEQRATFCRKAKDASKWIDETKEQIKELLAKEPMAVPGFTLKPGNKRETVTNPTELFARFQKIGGKLEAFMRVISIVKSRLKEEVHAATGAKGKHLESALETLTEGIVEVSQNAPSIVEVTKE